MMRCPQCKQEVTGRPVQCPRCKADLSLLSDVMSRVEKLRGKAADARANGAIGAAVEAYLEMLELDPTDEEARAAVGQSVRAIRSVLRLDHGPRRVWPYWLLAAFAAVAGLLIGHYSTR